MNPVTGGDAHPALMAALPLRSQSELISDWTLLKCGDKVDLKKGAYRTYSGYIEEKTLDSTIIWLSNSGAFGRRMAYSNDVEQVWRTL